MLRDALRGVRLIVVGFSGGIDSSVLLGALQRAMAPDLPRVLALHVDHRARPDSGADAAACARIAARHSLPFRCLRADPARYRAAARVGEHALRAERYRLFALALRETGAGALYLAHQCDDQIESVILGALRGGGLRALRGMPRRRALTAAGGHLVRPLLRIPRTEVARELQRLALPYLSDPTNEDVSYLRNHVRHVLLPRLRRDLGPALDERIHRLGRVSRVLWRRAITRARAGDLRDSDSVHAALGAILGAPARRRTSLLVQELLRAGGTRRVTVARGMALVVRDGALSLSANPPPTAPSLGAPQVSVSTSPHARTAARLLRAIAALTPEQRRARIEARGRIFLDADRVTLPLCVRTRAPGDRIHALGLRAPKRLKTLFIAHAVPHEQRNQLVVIADRAGVVGVEGFAPDANAALHANTRRVLRIVVRRDRAER